MFSQFMRRIKVKYFCKTNEQKIKYLRERGMRIGNNVRIHSDVSAFHSEPYLISIGDDTLISSYTNFINHDGGMAVINNLNMLGKRMDKLGEISVGTNCFIGMNVIILPGVHIGNNCIIGAGAVVTKDIPDNAIACGVPAKVVSTIDDFVEKNKERFYPTARMSFEDKKSYCEEHILKGEKDK